MKFQIVTNIFIFLISFNTASQELIISNKLEQAYQKFVSDTQLAHAISSFYVIDGSNKIVFDKNSQVGLAPASTQKIITSVTAFELLGKNYQYKTEFGYSGQFKKDTLKGNIVITGSGDPSLGSWRWESTKESVIMNKLMNGIRKLKVKSINEIELDRRYWEWNVLPDGWIWQDIGNYYGADASKLNWRENQYDVILKSGKKVGEPVSITGYNPKLYSYQLISLLRSAEKGTGDNAYIYLPFNSTGLIRGTIPIEETEFVISGSFPSPAKQLVLTLQDSLVKNKITSRRKYNEVQNDYIINTSQPKKIIPIYSHFSPSLDSLIFYFNRRSINLYGEALVKTIAFEKLGMARTDSGISVIKNFWKEKGLDPHELNIYDGSGLSPLNRVTTHAQVEILKYAKKQTWFKSFYESLPLFNGIKMKSGTISDVKSFTGYHTSRDGKEYIFSFIINNYMGSSSELVQKMYKVLDVLK